jgi:hypothetical protein
MQLKSRRRSGVKAKRWEEMILALAAAERNTKSVAGAINKK